MGGGGGEGKVSNAALQVLPLLIAKIFKNQHAAS